jgi:L-alanine-DL-glutamate epimerase-like enolase superfamily enzyme
MIHPTEILIMADILSERIVRIEKVMLKSPRPRFVGVNSKGGPIGDLVTDHVVRIHTDGGAIGVGWSRVDRDGAEQFLGKQLNELFELPDGCLEAGVAIDLPLWDLVAKLSDLPLYKLLGARGSREVEVYDGSVYIDDLEASDGEAVEIFQEEVRTGQEHGFVNFKIKIGRGAKWMPIMEGLERDVLVIKTIREAAGSEAKILVDANNGTTLNIAKEILRQCEDVGIYWFEEAFHEERPFNEPFMAFIQESGYDTYVADGESGPPPPSFFDMVKQGWIDIVQQDFRAKGLTWWKATADMIAPWGAQCGPHCWGSVIEKYAHAHFAASIPNFCLLEASPADTQGVILDGWELRDGHLIVPDTPGTGFDLEPEMISRGSKEEGGFSLLV